ncbi:hypothetical protein [Pseudodesulfovibrio sp.]|uniref:hypothetical protein n=1 Tax=Pseudodesulfovibrio sp. TaxID=2035812 RepID=UPI003D0B9E8E
MYVTRKASRLPFSPHDAAPFCEVESEVKQGGQRLFLLGEMWFEYDEAEKGLPPTVHEYWLGSRGGLYSRVLGKFKNERDVEDMPLSASPNCVARQLVVAYFYGRFWDLWEEHKFNSWVQFLPESPAGRIVFDPFPVEDLHCEPIDTSGSKPMDDCPF